MAGKRSPSVGGPVVGDMRSGPAPSRPGGSLKDNANTRVERLKAAEGRVLRAPVRPREPCGLGKACVNLAVVLT